MEPAVNQGVVSDQVRVVNLQHLVGEEFDVGARREVLGREEVAEGVGTEGRGGEGTRGAREEGGDALEDRGVLSDGQQVGLVGQDDQREVEV